MVCCGDQFIGDIIGDEFRAHYGDKCDTNVTWKPLRRKSPIIATVKWEYNVKMHHKDT